MRKLTFYRLKDGLFGTGKQASAAQKPSFQRLLRKCDVYERHVCKAGFAFPTVTIAGIRIHDETPFLTI